MHRLTEALDSALRADLSMDMFMSMAANGSLHYGDITVAERASFGLFVELGWLEYAAPTSRYYLTDAGAAVVDRAEEAGRAAISSSLISAAALGEG